MGESLNKSFKIELHNGEHKVIADPDAFKAMAKDAAIGRIYRKGEAELLLVDKEKNKKIDDLTNKNLKLEKDKSFRSGIMYSLGGGLVIETLILIFVK